MAGIPLGSYSCLETGRYRLNLENLLRILEALKIDIAQVWPRARPPRSRRPKKVTRAWLRRVVRESARRRPRPISMDDVVQTVCQVCDVSEEDLASPSRLRHLSEARKLAAFALRGIPQLNMVQLARRIGRDTSSLTHGMKRAGTPWPRSALGIRLGAVRKLLRDKAAALRKAAKKGRRP